MKNPIVSLHAALARIDELEAENRTLAEGLMESQKVVAASEFMKGMAEPVTVPDTPLADRAIVKTPVWRELIAHGERMEESHDRKGMARILWALLDFCAEHYDRNGVSVATLAESWLMHFCNEQLEIIADYEDRLGAAFDARFSEFLESERRR